MEFYTSISITHLPPLSWYYSSTYYSHYLPVHICSIFPKLDSSVWFIHCNMSCLLRLSEVALVLNTFTAISPLPTFTNKIKTQLSEVVQYCGHVHLESYGESNIMRSHFYDHNCGLESILNTGLLKMWWLYLLHSKPHSSQITGMKKPSLSHDVLIYVNVI